MLHTASSRQSSTTLKARTLLRFIQTQTQFRSLSPTKMVRNFSLNRRAVQSQCTSAARFHCLHIAQDVCFLQAQCSGFLQKEDDVLAGRASSAFLWSRTPKSCKPRAQALLQAHQATTLLSALFQIGRQRGLRECCREAASASSSFRLCRRKSRLILRGQILCSGEYTPRGVLPFKE